MTTTVELENRNCRLGITTIKFITTAIITIYIFIAAALVVNRSSSTIIGYPWHMQHYNQYAEGGHCYYESSDLHKSYDGYTPFASQLFGWAIRYIGSDVRVVKTIIAIFGCSAIFLIGLITYTFSKDYWLSYIAAGMGCAIEPICI